MKAAKCAVTVLLTLLTASVASAPTFAAAAAFVPASAPVDTTVFARLGADAKPVAALMDRSGSLVVLNEGDATVSTITAAGMLTRTFASLGPSCRPQAMTIDRKGYLFVACGGTDSVSRVAPDGSVIRFWAYDGVASMPRGIAADAAGNIYVANWGTSTITRIAASGSVQPVFATLAGGAAPIGLATDARGTLYVAENQGDRISTVTSTGVVNETFAALPSGAHPSSLSVDPWGSVYAALASGGVTKVAPDGHIAAPGIPLPPGPHRATVVVGDPFGDVFVGDELSGSVAAVDAAAARVETVATFGAPALVRAVALGSASVFAADYYTGDIRRTEFAPTSIPLTLPATMTLGVPVSLGLRMTGVFSSAIVSVGELPPGLNLDSASGSLTGTPITEGTYLFDIVVVNHWGATAPQHLSVEVRRREPPYGDGRKGASLRVFS